MGKTETFDGVSHGSFSSMKTCELGSISKSLKASLKKLQALGRGHEGVEHKRSTTRTCGVPKEPRPPDLKPQHLDMLQGYSKSSSSLESIGKTSLLPDFNGSNARSFVSWLYEVDFYLKDKCFSEKKKLELVESCFKRFALGWYNTLNLSRTMKGKGRIRTWFKLEMEMRLKFLPCSKLDELWAELKSLKQNSLSVVEYAKLFEELCFICELEVDSLQKGLRFYLGLNSEIARRINLRLNSSFDKLFELALSVEKRLASLKKHEVLAKMESLEAMKTVEVEESLGQGFDEPCLNVVHHEFKVINPNTISTNVKVNGSCNASFEGNLCRDSSKGEARGGAWVVPYLRVPNLTSYNNHDPCFKAYILRGITCHKSAPHFHFYMLIRLKVSLVQLGVIPFMLIKGLKLLGASFCELFWSIESNRFSGLNYDSWVLFMLLRRNALFEMIMLVSSRWDLFVNNGIDSFISYCSILKFLCLGVNEVQVHCESLLEVLRASSAKSIHGIKGALAHLVLFVLSPMHMNKNRPLVALLCSLDSNYGPSLGEHVFSFLACQVGKEQPQSPLGPDLSKDFGGKRVFDPRKYTWGCVQSSRRANQRNEVLKYGFRNTTTQLLSLVILIYDPGGRHDNWSLEVVFKLERACVF